VKKKNCLGDDPYLAWLHIVGDKSSLLFEGFLIHERKLVAIQPRILPDLLAILFDSVKTTIAVGDSLL